MRLVTLTFAERCCTLAAVVSRQRTLAAEVSRQRISMSTPPSSFIEEVNTQYEGLHRAFEEQARQYESPPIREPDSIAALALALSLCAFALSLSLCVKLMITSPPAVLGHKDGTQRRLVYSRRFDEGAKGEMEAFLASKEKLAQTRGYLARSDLSEAERATLAIFERTFGCYIMESEAALALREKCTAIEGTLEDARNKMRLGAVLDGASVGVTPGAFVELSSVGLRSKMRVDGSEATRKACWEGLRSIGEFVTANGFVELVRARNAMARELGYEDFYDYKVTQAEGFGKGAPASRCPEVRQQRSGTRPLMEEARANLAAAKGEAALLAYNSAYMMAGSVTQKLDPYFPFERAVEQWGRSFAALGISYEGASMRLDLLDRKGDCSSLQAAATARHCKYSNGFCHWPQPAWVKADGSFQPTVTHFTSLADPSAVGSGHTALTTLMHEAGHAAHFANIKMPSPLFSQERAPTSVAYAELQSMFLDSLVGDAAWRFQYARDREGSPLPFALHEEDVRAKHPYEVFSLRAMLAVPYFEKALYELPDGELSAAAIQARSHGDCPEITRDSPPPSRRSPARYVLAEMAVHQTRAFFAARDGVIVDNPRVGPTLRDAYWRPGNSEPFLGLAANGAAAKAAVDLDMRVTLVDGDEVIADTTEEGDFLAACKKFEGHIRQRFPRAAAA
ncbi:hypothetical protein EMIHUDRAFT_454829 [Emiliania huxleyi CCMP1516]|uniref:Peptidase M3A/M3B catalytic domain-containing protein n=2 Tax=Emiliania huxleyi TaxID=2903 RepID=A0A0D3KPG5_EMIH1|nr:hypothetical protein EMIHUDRAFT_454829 [Emiliania huxleyi CCMP1516]EOD37650.1 hypothetical protein EMIHUDRAFT_454829 [Emiliania huxleyi CCMP1516]|eukprot:XP_005790079.1 hypothetical protein EMIHUDRAFT_454829 [Emiliania huxleyi CCMP1516]